VPYGNGDFSNLLPSIPSSQLEEAVPVAQLLYHCAVSIDKDFDPNPTLETHSLVVGALRGFFGYMCDYVHTRSQYPTRLWIYRFRNNLERDLPIFMGYESVENMRGYCSVCHRITLTDDDMSIEYVMGIPPGQQGTQVLSRLPLDWRTEAIFDIQPNPDGLMELPPEQAEGIEIGYRHDGIHLRWQAAERATDYLVIRKPLNPAIPEWELVGEEIIFDARCEKCVPYDRLSEDPGEICLYRVIARNKSGWTFSEPVLGKRSLDPFYTQIPGRRDRCSAPLFPLYRTCKFSL
jgi:hypothetical protein